MDFKQLRSFVAVARLQSFTRAAEELYISQPTISTHIHQLEDELNVRLILRTTKKIELTTKGEEFYNYANSVLKMTNSLLKRWETENLRIIQIGSSTIPSAYILPDVLPSYREKHPNFQFNIYQGDSRDIINGLLDDHFEVGMVGMKDNSVEGIEYVPFYEDSMVLIAPTSPRYQEYASQPEPDILQLLRTDPIIVREQGSGSRKCIDQYFHKMGILEDELHITARLNDQESIKQLVASGLGISIISRKAAENYVADGKLLIFDLPDTTPTRQLYIIYKKGYILRKQTEDFIAFLRKYYQS